MYCRFSRISFFIMLITDYFYNERNIIKFAAKIQD